MSSRVRKICKLIDPYDIYKYRPRFDNLYDEMRYSLEYGNGLRVFNIDTYLKEENKRIYDSRNDNYQYNYPFDLIKTPEFLRKFLDEDDIRELTKYED